MDKIKCVVRVWKGKQFKPTPILIFPYDADVNFTVGMWEPVGQHGSGNYSCVMSMTRPATNEEAEQVCREYERYYSGCGGDEPFTLVIIKKASGSKMSAAFDELRRHIVENGINAWIPFKV
jgi:hypothetical protein